MGARGHVSCTLHTLRRPGGAYQASFLACGGGRAMGDGCTRMTRRGPPRRTKKNEDEETRDESVPTRMAT